MSYLGTYAARLGSRRRVLAILGMGAVALASLADAPAAAAASTNATIHVMRPDHGPISNAHVFLFTRTVSDLPQVVAAPREARSNGKGQAAFAIAMTSDERRIASANNGWLNFIATVTDDHGLPIAFTAFSRYTGSDAGQAAEARAISRPIEAVARPEIKAASRASRRSAGQTVTTADALTDCWNFQWELTSSTWLYTRIAELHAASDYNDAYFEYGSSADTNIDVGFKATGGPWTVSGTLHEGTSLGTAYGQHAAGSNYGWGVEAPFNYNEFLLYADCTGHTHQYQNEVEVESPGYHTGFGLSKQIAISEPARNPNYTTAIFADQSWHRYTSQLATIGVAITAFGFSAGAQTGATTNADYYYYFGHLLSHHYIYGNNAKPETSGRVYESSN